MQFIDLRSDTVTKPTQKMREAMLHAEVGDDVYREDPTTNVLETRMATLFEKEAALFFPSCTMCNLSAIMTWCDRRGGEIIAGDKSHIVLFEQAGASQFGGVSFRTVPNLPDGTMDPDAIAAAIRDDDIHEPITQLICIENTHNVCGGKVVPVEFMQSLRKLADKHKLPIHMDGARLWNAIAVNGLPPSEIAKHVDSLSICLSKGLGAPIGSLLVGSREFIEKARRIRKALGGGMRQSGVLASAGLVALDDFETGILKRDHDKAKQIAEAMAVLGGVFRVQPVETNIIFVDIVKPANAYTITQMLKGDGILISAWAPQLIRIVVHRDIDELEVIRVIEALFKISQRSELFELQ
jgi:threonine aldolase